MNKIHTPISFMQEALSLAKTASKQDEIPVGAVLVDYKKKKIIAKSYNKTKQLQDPTAHAEILLLNQAKILNKSNYLDHCDIYVTLEPCTMCAAALSLARVRRLYFATAEPKFGAVISNINYYESTACHHKIDYYYGFCEVESKKLLKSFFSKKR
jgi:tRNA(adenine34) deaminase